MKWNKSPLMIACCVFIISAFLLNLCGCKNEFLEPFPVDGLETKEEYSSTQTQDTTQATTYKPVVTPTALKRFYMGEVTDAKVTNINHATIMSGQAGVFDLTDPYWWTAYAKEWTKETVVNLIDQYKIPEGEYYLDGQLLSEQVKEELLKRRAMNSIPMTPSISYGIVVNNTAVRIMPTPLRLTMAQNGTYDKTLPETFDRFQESMLTVGEGVIILNTSTDGNYYFVQAQNDYGWVLVRDVVKSSYEVMCGWLSAMDFCVVTVSDITCRLNGEEINLRMGTKLLAYKETQGSIYLLIPVKEETKTEYVLSSRDGSFALYEAKDMQMGDLYVDLIIVSKDEVQKGYLPLNDENVKLMATHLLGTSYGWGDENGMDCSSTVNAVFKTFGFMLPRNTNKMENICGKNSNVVSDIQSLSGEKKRDAIIASPVGSILLMPGHVMIYMGYVDNEPMILHNVVAYMSPDNTVYCPIGSCVMTSLDIVSRDVHYYERINYIISLYE